MIKEKCRLLYEKDNLNIYSECFEILKNIYDKYLFEECNFVMFHKIFNNRNFLSHPQINKMELENKIYKSSQYLEEDKRVLLRVLGMYKENNGGRRRR